MRLTFAREPIAFGIRVGSRIMLRATLTFLLAMIALSVQANAAIYTIEDVVQTPKLATLYPFPATNIAISDAAVQREYFSAVISPTGPNAANFADFISFTSGQVTVSSNGSGVYYGLSISLVFATDGTVKTASLGFSGINPGFTLTGTGSALSGNYYPFDSASCLGGPASDCAVTARIVQTAAVSSAVPEPATFLLLGTGILGLVLSKRQVIR